MAINILMCGGRRTGKTSIMSAIEKNVLDMFPKGDIVLNMENSNELELYRKKQRALFGPEYEEAITTVADMMPSSKKSEYLCNTHLKGRQSKIDLNFIDVPGEWFIDREHDQEIQECIRNSQVLIIAIDTPHMMEKEGADRIYHDVYNRVNILTEKIKIALQGNDQKRMILFVPLKCEAYKNEGRMPEVLEAVKESYEELITYFTTGNNKGLCTVAVTPVITMGGLRFLRFVMPLDEDGNVVCDKNGQPIKIIDVSQDTDRLEMQWPAEYYYLQDSYGDHFYEPKDCEQPLIYILLFLIGISKQKVQGFFRELWAEFRKMPNLEILEGCKDDLIDKRKVEAEEGFEILQDPEKMLQVS